MFEGFAMILSQQDLHYFSLFSFDRLDNATTWISVGFLCYCLFDAITGLKLWHELSKISPKYNSEEINHNWKKGMLNHHEKMTKGSLIEYVEIDNPEECAKLQHKYRTFKHEIQRFMNEGNPFADEATHGNVIIDQRFRGAHSRKP